MNEIFVAAKYAACLIIPATLLVAVVRPILGKFRAPPYPPIDLPNEIGTQLPLSVHDFPHTQAAHYVKPTFKRNNLEDEMIARSFVLNKRDNFMETDENTEMGLHLAGLCNALFVED